MRFDLLIKGGQVIDPGTGIEGMLDVAVKGDRIAAVGPNIPADAAHVLIDAVGTYVTPGLVDMHSHVFKGSTYWGIDADALGSRSGVTSWGDAGSAGALTLEAFRNHVIAKSRTRIFSFMNISNVGLTGTRFELASLEQCDTRLFQEMTNRNRDIVVGVKVRMSTPEIIPHGLAPLHRALEAAAACDLRLMMHIGIPPPDIRDVLPLLREGDIVTHCFTGWGMDIVDRAGSLLDVTKQARDRGVIFDLGHGAGSFDWRVAEAATTAGFWPDVLSSDINQLGLRGPVFDLPTVMSKMLRLGMTLRDAVRAATIRPAELMGISDRVGSLRTGAFADIALFTLRKGRFSLYDKDSVREGDVLLRNEATIVGGRRLQRQAHQELATWMTMDPFWPPDLNFIVERQRLIGESGHDPDSMASSSLPIYSSERVGQV